MTNDLHSSIGSEYSRLPKGDKPERIATHSMRDEPDSAAIRRTKSNDKPVLSAYTVPIPVLDCVKELITVVRGSKTALEGILAEEGREVSGDLLNASERLSGALRAIYHISQVYGVKCPVELD